MERKITAGRAPRRPGRSFRDALVRLAWSRAESIRSANPAPPRRGTHPQRARRRRASRGRIVFRAPRADTLTATWFGQPEQAIVSGWPADVGPFAGVSLAWAGRDSLSGSILLDSKLGVQARPGMTARVVAGRAQRLSSAP